jgi:membrane protein
MALSIRSFWMQLAATRSMRILMATATGWSTDHISRLASSLSFYALLSLIPLLVTFHALVSLFIDQHLLVHAVDSQIASLIGPAQAQAVRSMLDQAQAPSLRSLQAIIGSILTFVTAGGVFVNLKDSMDAIWETPSITGPRRWLRYIADYFGPMSMVLGFGFLLLISLLLDGLVSAAGSAISGADSATLALIVTAHQVVSWIIATLLFAAIFRFFPTGEVAWRDVWLGSVITSTLFSIGRFLIGFYLGTSDFTGHYGAAGAVVAIIVWIYYSAQILFIGAVFTREHARTGEYHDPSHAAY